MKLTLLLKFRLQRHGVLLKRLNGKRWNDLKSIIVRNFTPKSRFFSVKFLTLFAQLPAVYGRFFIYFAPLPFFKKLEVADIAEGKRQIFDFFKRVLKILIHKSAKKFWAEVVWKIIINKSGNASWQRRIMGRIYGWSVLKIDWSVNILSKWSSEMNVKLRYCQSMLKCDEQKTWKIPWNWILKDFEAFWTF